MSGHSKWSKVKHQKAGTDAVKSAAFTRASRAITLSVREGGNVSDPNFNFHLRLAIEKARAVNMPKENIFRAIEKATKEGESSIQSVSYEGYGPFGVAFYITTATDNINRTVSNIKQILEHAGGSMASPGAVSYLFTRRGVCLIAKTIPFDELFEKSLLSGADDVVSRDDVYEVYTKPDHLSDVKNALEKNGIVVSESSLCMDPIAPLFLTPEKLDIIQVLVERLEDLDDVQEVYTNI